MTKPRTVLSISIIETKGGGLALQIATKEGEKIEIAASDATLAAFVSQGAKALQHRARKASRH